jgi:hypothetical protein
MAKDAVTSEDVRPRKGDAEKVLGGPPPEEDADVAGTNVGTDTVEAIQEMAKKEEKKLRQEQTRKVLEEAALPGRVLLKMERKNSSWTTRSGVIFTQEHPFQLVPEEEVEELLREGGFRRADPQEVVYFYAS